MPKISFSLPVPGKIVVDVGIKVEKNDTLAIYEEAKIINLNLTNLLELKPQKIYKTLVKKPGDKIEIDDIIAIKKQIFGKKIIYSPVSGKLLSLDETRGILTIEIKGEEKKLLTPVGGQIIEIIDDKTVVIDFNGLVYEAKECLNNRWGELSVLGNVDEAVDLYQIQRARAGKILVGYNWPKECIKKAFALDCAVIGVEIDEKIETLSKINYLASEIPSVMIIGRNSFLDIIKAHGKQAILASRERKLYVSNL